MKVAVLAFVLLTGIAARAPDASAQALTPENIISFADYLYAQGDYYRAITEYERLIFYNPGHPLAKTAAFQIAMSYLKGEKFAQAAQRFRTIADSYPREEVGRKALFMLAETYYEKKDYGRAGDVFEVFLNAYPEDPRADPARIKRGWCFLRQGDWRQAAEEFQKLPADSPLHGRAAGLAEGSKNYPVIPKKSPALAGGLSAVLPGAGQLYIGRPGDAAVSFLLNGTFIWATADAYNRGSKVTAGILLFFESGWYLGNIYNAVSGAHKYNQRAEAAFMDGLQGRYGLSWYRDDRGNDMLALTLKF